MRPPPPTLAANMQRQQARFIPREETVLGYDPQRRPKEYETALSVLGVHTLQLCMRRSLMACLAKVP